MEILVDHLTRMAAGYICVAGLDAEGRHVRPILEGRRLSKDLLAENGGPFAIGSVVDVGSTRESGASPFIEDCIFDPNAAHPVERPDDGTFWAALDKDAELLLVDIFGHDLDKDGPGATVPIGAGRASLGTLDPGYRPRLTAEDGKLRCHLIDPVFGELRLSVTDLSLHRAEPSGWAIKKKTVESLECEMKAGRSVFLSVGLGRPWPKDNPRHWLQVNNIHLHPDTETPSSPKSYSVDRIRLEYPRAYAPWTREDEQLLTLLCRLGQSIAAMAKTLGRQPRGIASRLKELGLAD